MCCVGFSIFNNIMDNALNKQHQKLFLCNLACFYAFLLFCFFFFGFFGKLLLNSMHHMCGFLRLLTSLCVYVVSRFFSKLLLVLGTRRSLVGPLRCVWSVVDGSLLLFCCFFYLRYSRYILYFTSFNRFSF